MISRVARFGLLSLAVAVLALPAMLNGEGPPQKRGPRRIYPPPINGYASARRAIELFDADQGRQAERQGVGQVPGPEGRHRQGRHQRQGRDHRRA